MCAGVPEEPQPGPNQPGHRLRELLGHRSTECQGRVHSGDHHSHHDMLIIKNKNASHHGMLITKYALENNSHQDMLIT